MSVYKRNNRLVFLNVVENAVKKKKLGFYNFYEEE